MLPPAGHCLAAGHLDLLHYLGSETAQALCQLKAENLPQLLAEDSRLQPLDEGLRAEAKRCD